jgi:hypothetical protein
MGKRESYLKKTPVICPICGKEFMGSSSKNIKGCANYECSAEWEQRERKYDRDYYKNYRKQKREKK